MKTYGELKKLYESNCESESNEYYMELTKKKKEIALKILRIYESEEMSIRDTISINQLVSKMMEMSKVSTNGFYEYFDNS